MRSLLTVATLAFCFTVLTYTLVHGDEIKGSEVPTVDNGLRSNERVGSKTDDEVISREEEKMNPDGFSVKELKQLREQGEKHQFQAEVNKLMNIIINSLYSKKEIFLRELISNASDALDKIRFLSLTDSQQLDSGANLEIKIKADSKSNTLHIIDTGIGMTKDELINNLGTIAKSGTTEFLEKFKNKGGDDTTSLIGQFGVGFYSVYLIADEVTVISKNNNDKQWIWQSDAQGSFSVAEDPRGNTLGRGSEIILHLKSDAATYLDQTTLRGLVKKYSEFINFPIYLWETQEIEKEVPMTEEEIKAEQEKEKADSDEEAAEEIDISEKKEESEAKTTETKTKKVKESVSNWELMNSTKPLWTRSPKELTDEEYNNFYKSFSKDTTDPIMHIHFNAEGEVNFKSLLFIPGTAPTHMFDPNAESENRGLKLYVRRVFITDDFRDILPKYLSFIKGVVDSDDMPLNVSREMLQEHSTLKVIKKKLVRKAIAMFQSLAEDKENKEKYLKFWENFGTSIKLGVIEDASNRLRLSKLLMFNSSKTGELTTLQDYVERMKSGQNQIYYLAGESKSALETSPLIERLVKKGYEVLYMTDPIDEYAVANLEKFDGKYKLTNIGKEGLKLDGEEEDVKDKEQKEKEFEKLTVYLKKVLGSKIEKVVISSRLTQSPSALVSSSFGWTANMERIIKAQALADKSQHAFMAPKKVLEINPKHPIVIALNERISSDVEDQSAKDIAELMYETAALTSGFSLDDSATFAKRIVKIMNRSLGLDPEAAPVEEPEPEPVQNEVPPQETESKDEL